jgi:2'-5' RNA ligase
MKSFDHSQFEVSALSFPATKLIPYIQSLREKYTRDGAEGMEPHFTAHYPFVSSKAGLDSRRKVISEVCRTIRPFSVKVREIAQFPNGVIYLKPEATIDTAEIMKTFARNLPDFPPYEGKIPLDQLHSHITVATTYDPQKKDKVLGEIARALSDVRPIAFDVAALNMYARNQGRWFFYESFELGF